jgi:polyhydroxyalkanoate synthesis regulator phasin
MLHSVKKIARYSAHAASATKCRIEGKVKKFVKAHKVPIKEGKKLASGILREIKEDAVKVGDFISNAVQEELRKAKPFVKQGKNRVKKTAKAFAKKAFHKAKAKEKSLARKVIRKAAEFK